jgi:hypothetical protein
VTVAITWRSVALVLAALSLAIFFGANAHLVSVALQSQPECVPHLKEPGSGFQAAKSAC